MKQRDLRRARRAGRRDGERAIPAAEATAHPPAVLGMIQRAEGALDSTTERWSAADGRLLSERTALRESIQQRRDAAPRRRAELAALRTRTTKRLGEVRRERQKVEERASGLHVPFWLYLAAIVVVFAAEFPLNAIAFQLFGEGQLMTWLMTAGLAIMLVVCAHFAGAALRGGRTTKERAIVAVAVAAPVGTLVSIALFRDAYVAQAAGGLIGTGLAISGFLTINLLLFAGAAILSYLAHDPAVPELRRLDAERRELDAALAAAEAQARADAAALEREQQRYPATQVEREKLFEATRSQAEGLAHAHRDLVAAYWHANLLARRDGATPPASGALPEVPIPRRLEKQLDPPRQLVADIAEERGDA